LLVVDTESIEEWMCECVNYLMKKCTNDKIP